MLEKNVEGFAQMNDSKQKRGGLGELKAECLGLKELDLYIPHFETEEHFGEIITLHDCTRKRTDSSLFMSIVGCSTSSGDAFWLISSLGLINLEFHQ